MAISTQYTGATRPNEIPGTSDDSVRFDPSIKPRVFSEDRSPTKIASTQNDGSTVPPNAPTARANLGERHVSPDLPLSREKRGASLGACAKSEFRECRGGEDLKEGSSSHVKFDQFDQKRTRGDDGRGTCTGIVHEAIRRIDRSGGATDLPSAVTYMSSEINGGKKDANEVFNRIQAFQDNPSSLGLSTYAHTGEVGFVGGTREARIDSVMSHLQQGPGLNEGALAYIGLALQNPDDASARSGHMILVQHLPSNATDNPSASRYAIFDPNNGVFTYDDWAHTETALRSYMDSAYKEDGYIVVPERVEYYSPSSHRSGPEDNYGSLPNRREPPEVGQRHVPGHDDL
jgi:hypothetical protein